MIVLVSVMSTFIMMLVGLFFFLSQWDAEDRDKIINEQKYLTVIKKQQSKDLEDKMIDMRKMFQSSGSSRRLIKQDSSKSIDLDIPQQSLDKNSSTTMSLSRFSNTSSTSLNSPGTPSPHVPLTAFRALLNWYTAPSPNTSMMDNLEKGQLKNNNNRNHDDDDTQNDNFNVNVKNTPIVKRNVPTTKSVRFSTDSKDDNDDYQIYIKSSDDDDNHNLNIFDIIEENDNNNNNHGNHNKQIQVDVNGVVPTGSSESESSLILQSQP